MKISRVLLLWLVSMASAWAVPDPAALKAELIRTEAEFFEFAFAHTFTEAIHTYMAPDGLVANSLTLGRDAQAERVKAEQAKAPKRADVIHWQPLRAEVAESGELGYTWGVAESGPTKEGPFKPYGIYVTIWKRQPDGKWKFVYDSATILTADRIEAFVREHFPPAGGAVRAGDAPKK